MRGADSYNEPLFSTVKLEEFVPQPHPLRPIRQWMRKLPHQVDSSEVETSWLNTLGRNSAGGMLPRESCGRYSL